jgi:hypothetical protein
MLPALPYAPGSNASGFAAVALSASPADSALAVSWAVASAALMTGLALPLGIQLPSHPCRR